MVCPNSNSSARNALWIVCSNVIGQRLPSAPPEQLLRRWDTMREITSSNVLAGWMFLQFGLMKVVSSRPTFARRWTTIGSF
mmetsp:Transcript_12036/g.17279  ORF Transcript_12036/g.17279 Transcript_12036/m.17279 type:complete len:81 (+) Transcript_12036:448-690(+)